MSTNLKKFFENYLFSFLELVTWGTIIGVTCAMIFHYVTNNHTVEIFRDVQNILIVGVVAIIVLLYLSKPSLFNDYLNFGWIDRILVGFTLSLYLRPDHFHNIFDNNYPIIVRGRGKWRRKAEKNGGAVDMWITLRCAAG